MNQDIQGPIWLKISSFIVSFSKFSIRQKNYFSFFLSARPWVRSKKSRKSKTVAKATVNMMMSMAMGVMPSPSSSWCSIILLLILNVDRNMKITVRNDAYVGRFYDNAVWTGAPSPWPRMWWFSMGKVPCSMIWLENWLWIPIFCQWMRFQGNEAMDQYDKWHDLICNAHVWIFESHKGLTAGLQHE